jgi:hypothetical protein
MNSATRDPQHQMDRGELRARAPDVWFVSSAWQGSKEVVAGIAQTLSDAVGAQASIKVGINNVIDTFPPDRFAGDVPPRYLREFAWIQIHARGDTRCGDLTFVRNKRGEGRTVVPAGVLARMWVHPDDAPGEVEAMRLQLKAAIERGRTIFVRTLEGPSDATTDDPCAALGKIGSRRSSVFAFAGMGLIAGLLIAITRLHNVLAAHAPESGTTHDVVSLILFCACNLYVFVPLYLFAVFATLIATLLVFPAVQVADRPIAKGLIAPFLKWSTLTLVLTTAVNALAKLVT